VNAKDKTMQIKHRIQLVDLMKELGLPLIAAEVGCAEALFSFDLLMAGVEKLWMVVFWDHQPNIKGDGNASPEWHKSNYEAAKDRVYPYKSKVEMLKGYSTKMAKLIPDNSLGLAYIDCNHEYSAVKADIGAYWPKLVKGAVMAFHDYENERDYGVKAAVKEFAATNNLEIHLIPENDPADAGAYIIKP
jgi:hypothetical protein